jgi:hypothetical protein
MKKLVLAGASIIAVVLLVLGSQANVVGYQTVQSSVKERLNEKDLLFQTICDLANNKEIQKAILESQGKLQNPFPSPQLPSFPSITKKQLNLMYFLGVVVFKMMGKARMESLIKAHPINIVANEKINSIIRNSTELKEEMAQLSILNCPSCSESSNGQFPILCLLLLFPFAVLSFLVFYLYPVWLVPLYSALAELGLALNCSWVPIPPE